MEPFEKDNKNALQLNHIATEDYLGARCCLYNGLIQTGYILACQAIEKLLKSHILFISPKENFKNSKVYPYHDLECLYTKLKAISNIELEQFKSLCYNLSKAYHSFRYPDNPSIVSYSIRSVSTAIIDEVDEMFIFLFEKLPVPDKLKCRIGLLGLMLVSQNVSMKEWFIKSNNAYIKMTNYFSKPLNWWLMDEEEKKRQPVITILSINDIKI